MSRIKDIFKSDNSENVSFLPEFSKQCSFQKSLALNRPYEYKGVIFYPVGLETIIEFYICVEVLMVKQERTRVKKLMKLPFLWFLVYAFEYDNEQYGILVPLLCALLELVTKSNDIDIRVEYDNNNEFKRCALIINGIEFNYKDFLEIRQIIFEQAGIEYSDEFLNVDAEKAIKQGLQYDQQKSGYVPPTFENLIDLLGMYLHKSTEEIVSTFTIRKFNNIIKYMSKFEEYKLLKSGEYSGGIKLKNPIPHWMSGFEKEDIFKYENKDYHKSNLMNV